MISSTEPSYHFGDISGDCRCSRQPRRFYPDEVYQSGEFPCLLVCNDEVPKGILRALELGPDTGEVWLKVFESEPGEEPFY